MSKKNRKYREHWYSGITEAFQMMVPGNKIYRTMPARRARTGYRFILPFIIGFLVFMLYPMVNSLMMSFSHVDILTGTLTPANESGLVITLFGKTFLQIPTGNYTYAFGTDPQFNQLLVNEIGRMAINVVATLILSFVIAVILNQKFKGRIICRVIFFLPVILSSGVLPGIETSNDILNLMSSINQSVQESSGVDISASLQNLLSVSGVGREIFDVIFQMIDSIYDIVMASGIQIIVFLSGLQSISPSLYEAADVEGCSAWESFWKITFPMVSPLLLVNCIYTIIDFFMKNDNRVIEHINDVMYGVQMDHGVASAESWIYFGVALLFIGISAVIIKGAVKSYE
uniref:Sugar ABC transporter permease n=1 Tax=uncultured bacterium Contig1477 TaxID=1393434 RepID=W0FJE5_9BACT|nr:sugar ABC transporter permease [uncultured bacterium Contig1477]